MQTVTLEILRHGPPNNQLLSPLTRYLALCGNHPAVTVELPYEHRQLLTRLRALRYLDSDDTRESQLRETGRELGKILASIPGLFRELGEGRDGQRDLIHLRLILSASELALLPFELVQSPSGFPGGGRPLALQTDAPVCITREVRRVRQDHVGHHRNPRILFAAASPPGVGGIPMRAHLAALRQAISPWLEPYDPEDPEDLTRAVDKHLTVLPHADVKSIERACKSECYTHIHLLAHGVLYESGNDRRYGVALHDSQNTNRKDIVEGDRLATVIRAQSERTARHLSLPEVVSLASCDSGNNEGSIVGAGASIAHELHEAGIPLVIASQFPLSFKGSVILVRMLYNGLLHGTDPRSLVDELRRQLRIQIPETHDWASVVAYVSFPADFDAQQSRVRISQAQRAIRAALKHATQVEKEISNSASKKSSTGWDPKKADPIDALAVPREKIREAKLRMESLLSTEKVPSNQVVILGQLASAEKQEAEILFHASHLDHFATYLSTRQREKDALEKAALDALEASLQYYDQAFAADRSQSWGLVQALVLSFVLDSKVDILGDRWELARLLAQQETRMTNLVRRSWAYGSLMELLILKWLSELEADRNKTKKQALQYADRFNDQETPDPFAAFSTIRQIRRYTNFFNRITAYPNRLRDVSLPEAILRKLTRRSII